jgi:glycosyltransferase involved in cell wall biosynthesis
MLWSPDSGIAARALYLVTWHPIRNRREFVSRTVRLAARRRKNYVKSAVLTCSILLKRQVSSRERGLLLVSFEPELAKLARLESLLELEKAYALAFLPTWQPFYSEALFTFAARATKPYWMMPSASADQELCADLGPLCRPLPFQASSWVSAANYVRVPTIKTIDLLMLANFSAYKRHWRLFEAIPSLPSTLRIVLAGRPYGGRTAQALLEQAEAFGVRDRITIQENPTDEQLAQLLASARLLCALSHKEGSYIAVAEAMMAGTAVAMFQNAVIGSREYICDETGYFLDADRPLAPQLLRCLECVDELNPKAWAEANISAEVNCVRLNELLRAASKQRSEPWTVDIAPFYCRHFEFEYLDPRTESEFKSAYATLERTYGVEIVRSHHVPA